MDQPYYRPDLARIHHLGFSFHAEDTAPGILSLLEPVRGGTVLEIGCGSGLLTRYLVEAGHQVIATDASSAMLELARGHVGEGADIQRLTLPDDPIPETDAIVGVGHALNYLDEADQVDRALVAIARALRPGGVLAIDLCDLEWAAARLDQRPVGWTGEDWALITEFSVPSPDRYVRQMATFTRNEDGTTWRRDDERHDNVMVDVSMVPALLAEHGVDATPGDAFGDERLPVGLKTIVGRKTGAWSTRTRDA
ncbi:MAG: methyltransferase domain-containing protein [Actinomycetota bacterium]